MSWIEYELGELLSYEQPTPYIVESTEYNDSYKDLLAKTFELVINPYLENINNEVFDIKKQ